MQLVQELKSFLRGVIDVRTSTDTVKAAESIKNNIYFRGPNVWILVCAIVLASVGLNVNSTAVIIGAMLVSPLMGPIFGVGLGLGTEDTGLIKSAVKNLLIMVVISLTAATIYFLITPLKLANPTELMSRTNPTIYDVMIALFGGLAGIFEQSRKEKGTVISGVAIATALMPPLCTAGYGLASGHITYFFGALYLFSINCVFIILATYIMVKYLKFEEMQFSDGGTAKKTKTIMSIVIILMIVPSIWSAFVMIRENSFSINVESFIKENKNLDNGYIYDYKLSYRKGGSINVFIAGEPLTASEKNRLIESAERHGIKESQLKFSERAMYEANDNVSEKLVKGIYERTDSEISRRESRIRELEKELEQYRREEIPYTQIAKEINSQYPEIGKLILARGAEVKCDSLNISKGLVLVTESGKPLNEQTRGKLENWLKIRLGDSTAVVISR